MSYKAIKKLIEQASAHDVKVRFAVIDGVAAAHPDSKGEYPNNAPISRKGNLTIKDADFIVGSHAGSLKIKLSDTSRFSEELSDLLKEAYVELNAVAEEKLVADIKNFPSTSLTLVLTQLSLAAQRGCFHLCAKMADGVLKDRDSIVISGKINDRVASFVNIKSSKDDSSKLLEYVNTKGAQHSFDLSVITSFEIRSRNKRFTHEHKVLVGVANKLLGVK